MIQGHYSILNVFELVVQEDIVFGLIVMKCFYLELRVFVFLR